VSLQVPLVTSLTFRSLGGPGRSEEGEPGFLMRLYSLPLLPTMHFTPGARGEPLSVYVPTTLTRTLTALCPATLSALMMNRPLWVSLLSGIRTTEVVSVVWI